MVGEKQKWVQEKKTTQQLANYTDRKKGIASSFS